MDNIYIPFSNPDSEGLCSIKVEANKALTMTCQNTENFDVSQIMISPSIISDKKGKPLFKISNDFTASSQFGCTISYKSTLPKLNIVPSTYNNEEETDRTSNGIISNKKSFSSKGLNGGAIAGIVIGSVGIVAIVGVVIILLKKGIISGTTAVMGPNFANQNSSIYPVEYNKSSTDNVI